jgi:hypothetical protein
MPSTHQLVNFCGNLIFVNTAAGLCGADKPDVRTAGCTKPQFQNLSGMERNLQLDPQTYVAGRLAWQDGLHGQTK